MKKLTKYILKEHAGPFITSLSIIMLVLVLKFISQYVGKIFGKGLSSSIIIEFLYLNLAWMLALAVPMAVLVATLMAFGRMASDNEIVAIRSSGISFIKIIRGVLIAGLLLTYGMYYFNDNILPEFNHRSKILSKNMARKKPTLDLQEGVFVDLGNKYSILANHIISNEKEVLSGAPITGPENLPQKIDRLEELTIIDYSNQQYQRTIMAEYGYMFFNEESGLLVLKLFNGEIHELENKQFAEYKIMKYDKNIFYIEAKELTFKRDNIASRGDREMNISMLGKKVFDNEVKIKKQEKQIKNQWNRFIIPLRTELALLEGDFDKAGSTQKLNNPSISKESIQKSLDKVRKSYKRQLNIIEMKFSQIKNIRKNINKYEVEIYKKLSIAFAIMVFILVGAPLGIKSQKGSMGVSFAISFGFFVIYWAFLIGGEELADRAILSPFISMWLPNFIIGSFGIFLCYRTVKETHPIQWNNIIPTVVSFFNHKRAKKNEH